MARSTLLTLLIMISAALMQSCMASATAHKASEHSAPESKRAAAGYTLTHDEYNQRLHGVWPPASNSMDQTQNIQTNMKNGMPFFGLQVPNHEPGQDDVSNYVTLKQSIFATGQPADVFSWADGAYSQLQWCMDAGNDTLYTAMQECGPKETCNSLFSFVSFWGTVSGMNWVQDGLMLYTCLAIETVEADCKDPSQYPCKYKMLGDFHVEIFPSNANVIIIGSGATSLSQMAQQIGAYNQANGTAYSLPSDGGDKSKRSELRRLDSA